MALNPIMPDDAGIDSEEFNEGTRTVEREEQPGSEPLQNRERDEQQRAAAGDEEQQQRENDGSREQPSDEQATDENKASEAGKELAKRKRGLEGRKETIQGQINALVRERSEIDRDTARGRSEREALLRDIETLREAKRRIEAGEDVEIDSRHARRGQDDPRGFDPRRPQTRSRDEEQPWFDRRDPRPQESQFQDFAEYAEAVGRWGARQEVRRAEYQRAQRSQQSERARWEEQRQQGYSERYQRFAAENPDFEREIDREDLMLTAPMVDAIKDSELGPQMLLHLARHPEDIDRIARLYPVLAFGEMKKIEARLESAHSGSRQSQQHQQHSQARPPIKPVAQTSSRNSSETDIPDEDVDMDEHIERMNKRDAVLRSRGIRGYGVAR